MAEYPKTLKHGEDGSEIVVANCDEETASRSRGYVWEIVANVEPDMMI
jgi:hypothetical protein